MANELSVDVNHKLKRNLDRLWHVVFINDDYTPFDFVVEVLMKYFSKNEESASFVALDVHHNGRGIAGTYSHDIAETKAAMALEYARMEEHPLQIVIRQADA